MHRKEPKPSADIPEGDSALRFQETQKLYFRSHLGRTTIARGIEGLNLSLHQGEIFGLLGLNGSGKTTTMKLALGLLAPTSGQVSVFGHPAGSRAALAQMGYLPEFPYFYSYLTPNEILTLYGRLSGMDSKALAKRIPQVIEQIGLPAHQNRRISEFSKGMLQRIGLGQAILHDPQILLLDEPVSGLDPLAIAEFRALLLELNRGGRTILLSSHSISEVERVCHRVGILVAGRLVRVLRQKDWDQARGHLEELFVETVRQGGPRR